MIPMNKIMKIYLSLIIAFSGLSLRLAAQKAPLPLGMTNTPQGIFIEVNHPDLAGKTLELQRKKAGETAFKTVARLTPPAEIGIVKARIAEAATVFTEGDRPTEEGLQQVWDKFAAKDSKTLELIAGIPQLEYVFGLAYLDKDTRQGEQYLYQVTEGGAVVMNTPKAFTREKLRYFPPLQELKKGKNEKAVFFELTYPFQLFFATRFEIKRKVITAPISEYMTIRPVISLPSDRRSQRVIVTDTTLKFYGDYHYQVRLSDIFGNRDTSVYYFEGNNIPLQASPEVVNVKIEPLKDERAFSMSWGLTWKERVQSVTLYRSREYDRNFEAIARFNKDENTYADQIQIANELYFYYFLVRDVYGNEWQSIKFQKVYEGTYIPAPPGNVVLNESAAGPVLSWRALDPKTRGFYVFRKESDDREFIQISAFIQAGKSGSGSFTDTSRLNRGSYYFYAVKAESDTYDQSVFSDTVTYYPPAGVRTTALKPPYDLNVSFKGNGVLISWEDVNESQPEVAGYQIYRKAEMEKEFKLLIPALLSYRHNYWLDTLIHSADKYQYLVVSTDGSGHFSEKSQPVEIDVSGYFITVPEELGYETDAKGVTIKWTEIEVNRIKQIKVYRSEDDGPLKLIATPDKKLKRYKDLTVKKGKSYVYHIATVGIDGKESQKTDPLQLEF